jgi:hypothetical protein
LPPQEPKGKVGGHSFVGCKSDAFLAVHDRKLEALLQVWADLPESVKDAPLVMVSDRKLVEDDPATKGLGEHLVAAGNGELGLDC